jgi:hypothetical protein
MIAGRRWNLPTACARRPAPEEVSGVFGLADRGQPIRRKTQKFARMAPQLEQRPGEPKVGRCPANTPKPPATDGGRLVRARRAAQPAVWRNVGSLNSRFGRVARESLSKAKISGSAKPCAQASSLLMEGENEPAPSKTATAPLHFYSNFG